MTGELRPLDGIRVLDFSVLFPGPLCTQILGDLGAEVVKVEPPDGDPSRNLKSAVFDAANRGKQSIVLNLKDEADRRLAHQLADRADVLVEGFRPGVMARLGQGPDELRERNPRLIYCSISGFGTTGPDRDRPGHDFSFLAASGLLSLRGRWKDHEPSRLGAPVTDLGAGTYAAIAILAALRRRDVAGQGAFIDVSLTDAALSLAVSRLSVGATDDQIERQHLLPTNDVFRAGDGRWVALGVVEQHFWERLRDLLAKDEPALLDPRFDDEDGRRQHGDDLSRLLAGVFAGSHAREWLDRLAPLDIPIDVVLTLPEAVQAARERGRIGPGGAPVPFLVDGEAPIHADPLRPEPDEHRHAILAGLEEAPAGHDRLPS